MRAVGRRTPGPIDAGVLEATMGGQVGAINAANLRRAHALIESGAARGKVVLDGSNVFAPLPEARPGELAAQVQIVMRFTPAE